MAIFAILFLGVALVLIGVGIALGMAAIAAASGMVSLGVLSSSVLIGIRAGKTESGIRAFLIQCGILAGIPAGAVCAWGAKHLWASIGDDWAVLLYGALGGALAGLSLAFIMNLLSRRIHAWAAQRISKASALARSSFH